MSKVKLRIVPVITKCGVKYLVQRKGFIFWRRDRNLELSFGFGLFVGYKFDAIGHVILRIEKVYGKSYSIQDYQP